MKFITRFFVTMMALMMICQTSFAGDYMPAGTILEGDSYVFNLIEADALKERIVDLEKKEELLIEYIELDENNKDQIALLEVNAEIAEYQLDEYKNITELQKSSLEKYRKKEKWDRVENCAIFAGGIAVTVITFIVVDDISDRFILDTSLPTANMHHGATIRF